MMPMINLKQFTQKYQMIFNYMVFLFNFLFAIIVSFGVSGGIPRLHDTLLVFCILNLMWVKPVFFKIFSPLLFLWLFYTPIGLLYGYPNYGMIASLLETNHNEALEFFDSKIIIYGLLVIAFCIVSYQSKKYIVPTKKQLTFFKYFSILLAVVFSVSIVHESKKKNTFTVGYSNLLYIFPHINTQYHFYQQTQQQLQALSNHQKSWTINHSHQTYQNYVLIIGESASKNYLSAYGYPIKTSPFLEKVYGTKYTQMIAPAPYTTQSVPRLLSISNSQTVEFYHNIIGLANQAQIETYWVSNQDKTERANNEIYYIANHSKSKFYLSEISPTSKRYDYQLLPIVKEILANKSDKPKLIVLHLMGSHPKFNKRVDFNKAHFKFQDKYLSDYLSSLLQTDMLIEELYHELKNTKQSFSIVYTADHALTPIDLKHGVTQFSLQTPLFKIASNDTHHKTDATIVSGIGFVWFLTEWLGIETKNQTDNLFLNDYKISSLDEVKIFDDKTKPYLSIPPFDGKLLKPDDNELREKQ